MYKEPKYTETQLVGEQLIEGESIELKVRRLVQNKEPIKDGAPLIYTERKDGVGAAYNIRTDRWELAAEAMDKVTKSKIAKRDEAFKEEEAKIIEMKTAEPSQHTAQLTKKSQSNSISTRVFLYTEIGAHAFTKKDAKINN